MNSQSEQDWTPAQGSKLLGYFLQLTPKQHEVLRFVAENRTSKEIAWELGISESAVNQRIESVRSRTGAPPRAALARAYRQYMHRLAADNRSPASVISRFSLEADAAASQSQAQTQTVALPVPIRARTAAIKALQSREGNGRMIPGVAGRANAGPSRTTAAIAITASIALVMMVGLGIMLALRYII